ncbi:unnamed protein product, partial [Discosporangium mesarthrocarpum]
QEALFQALDTRTCTKGGDWVEWMRRLGVELLRQSPSKLLRPCAALAQAYQPVSQVSLSPITLQAYPLCWT